MIRVLITFLLLQHYSHATTIRVAGEEVEMGFNYSINEMQNKNTASLSSKDKKELAKTESQIKFYQEVLSQTKKAQLDDKTREDQLNNIKKIIEILNKKKIGLSGNNKQISKLATFLDSCSNIDDLKSCKNNSSADCSITQNGKNIFRKRLSSLDSCLSQRIDFIKNNRFESPQELTPYKRENTRLVHYKYGDISFSQYERFNCQAVLQIDKKLDLFDTKYSTEQECLKKCKDLFKRLTKPNKKINLSCSYWPNKKDFSVIAIILNQKYMKSIWTSPKKNDGITNKTLVLEPKYNKYQVVENFVNLE